MLASRVEGVGGTNGQGGPSVAGGRVLVCDDNLRMADVAAEFGASAASSL
jgi:hypothetical protein